jgi:hypothetical protein
MCSSDAIGTSMIIRRRLTLVGYLSLVSTMRTRKKKLLKRLAKSMSSSIICGKKGKHFLMER